MMFNTWACTDTSKADTGSSQMIGLGCGRARLCLYVAFGRR